jgi:cytochrome b561
MLQKLVKTTGPVMHVLIAVSTVFLFLSSWWMMALPLPSKVFTYRAFPFQLHKNVGITMVALVLVLLYARIAYVRAMKAAGVRTRMPRSTTIQDVLLYGLVLVCAVSGYLSSVYSGWPTRLWWLISLPNWGYDNDTLNDFYADVHRASSYALLAIAAVHVGVATYATFRNEGFVRRMLRL